jgi:hypothetical protein
MSEARAVSGERSDEFNRINGCLTPPLMLGVMG